LARRKLNKYVFYGSALKVEYSPESENEDDIRMKMQDRIQSVLKRLETLKKQNYKMEEKEDEISTSKKSKPSLMNFYNQPVPLKQTIKSNVNTNRSKASNNNTNFKMNTKKRIHLLSDNNNTYNKNNKSTASTSSAPKRQRRRI